MPPPVTCWSPGTGRGGYGESERVVEITSAPAVWHHSGMPPLSIRWVLVRDPHGKVDLQALLCTDLTVDPVQLLAWFVRRWRLEVTWQETRAHLGMETQRQWNARAMVRPTTALLGRFSMITRWAGQVAQAHTLPIRQAVRYRKVQPTFADAIAVVRQHVWTSTHFSMSSTKPALGEIPSARLHRLTETLCYAA
jgi:hypothetical protein